MEVAEETNSTEPTEIDRRTDGHLANLILPSDFQVSTSAKNKYAKPPKDTSGITKISKFNRDLLQNCIFLLFFLSLLLICVVILKRTFKRKHRVRKISKVSFTRSRHRSSSSSGAWREKSDVGPSKIWNVQDLEYYYVEPRRILWESYYGQPNNRRGHLPHSSALLPPTTQHLDLELVTFGLFQETRSPPPKYKSVDEIRRVSLLELPTYSEATQTHFTSTNSIHENEDS